MRGFKQNIFYKLDEHPLVAKWWWNDPTRRICWVRLWNMLIVFLCLSFFPSLVVTVVLFYQSIYFHIFSFSYWLPFFLLLAFSLCCARFYDSRIFLVFGYLCIKKNLVVTNRTRPSVRPPLQFIVCEMSHLLAWSPRHTKSVFNLILDIQIMVNSKLSK